MNKQEAIDSLECFRRNTAHILGDNDEKVKTIETCMMLVQEAEEAEKWIPVSERLPEIDMSYPHHEDYLVQYDSGGIDVASWSNVNRFWTDHVTEPHWNCVQFAKVIAWMPLPESYKEGENGTGSVEAYEAITECMKAVEEQPTIKPEQKRGKWVEKFDRIIRELGVNCAYDMPSFWCNQGKDYKVIPTQYHKGYMQALADVEERMKGAEE